MNVSHETEQEREEMFNAVPVGVDAALTSRSIWKIVNRWAERSFAKMLNDLVLNGKIQRRQQAIPTGFQWVYWRDAA